MCEIPRPAPEPYCTELYPPGITICPPHVIDLSGKYFDFPDEGDRAHVKLTPEVESLSAVTVCLRSVTELKRDHSLFSLAVPSQANGFLIYVDKRTDTIEVHVHGARVCSGRFDYAPNKWYSICATWEAKTGEVQLWVNGQQLKVSCCIQNPLYGKPIVTLGQEQDGYGGGFKTNQSFVGLMTDVHMWDYVLSPCEIQKFNNIGSFTPGNVLNWTNLNYEIIGKVRLENKERVSICGL